MSHASSQHSDRRRLLPTIAAMALCVSAVLSAEVAQGRVDPAIFGQAETQQSITTIAKVTGGGTVFAFAAPDQTVSSFGLNARRPVSFLNDGDSDGRLNYNRHRGGVGRHVNAPVVFMQAEVTNPPSPNGTGGKATIIADCTIGQTTCPETTVQVVAYLEDNSDSGANSDVFRIFYCDTPPTTPLPDLGGPNPEVGGCAAPEGGLLRTGNIQIRGDPGLDGEVTATAAAAGAFSTTPTLGGVELAGGRYGVGVRVASGSGNGDLEVQYNGVSLIGMFQTITISGWITGVSVNGGTWTLNGTGTLDMGDGAPPASGLPLVATLTSSGLAVTINGTAVPSLPKADGFIVFE